MSIGDTCTLIVGEIETEMTIDNASNGGGFGGVGGGGMPGRNGFGGGQMPDRGGFGRNGGTFDGDKTDEKQANESIQNGNELSATTTTLVTSLPGTTNTESQNSNATGDSAPSNAQNANTPPDFPGNGAAGGMQPPDMQDGADGGTPPDFSQRDMDGDGTQPDSTQGGTTGDDTQSNAPQGEANSDGTPPTNPQDGMNGGGMWPDMSQRNGDFGERFGWDMGNMQNQGNTSQATDTGVPISGETLILLSISTLVLLAGCAVAALYKRRG